MSLTRKERLDELGLWPAWRLRDVAPPQVAQAPSPASALVAQAPPPAPEHLRQGVHERGYLPHLKAEGGIYFVTFRLADSLPAEVLAQLEQTPPEKRMRLVDVSLDQAAGECWLARPEIAAIVRDALLAEQGRDCKLHFWVVMPNHVHALIEPAGEAALSDILQRVKSVSAHQANQALGRSGAFWQRESYDHLIRDQRDFERHLEYIRANPERAGLVAPGQDYPWRGPSLDAGEGACATQACVTGDVTGLDWDALHAAIRSCTRCPLHQSRSQGVPGMGDRQAEWLFVGEAPGAEEDRQGEPFVGQAGKLLDAMLAAIRLRRGENVFIANVLKSRPPSNRDPEPAEVAACLPYLERQIELIRPKLIVALGRFAAQSLLGTDTVLGKLRGRVHSYQGVPLVVTYHPAYLLRNPADKAKVWEDLVLAVRTMDGLKQPS